MRLHAALALSIAAGLLSACASPDQICRVRDLSGVSDAADSRQWSGTFPGIETIRSASSADNINILFVHGIGWTQQVSDQPFGFDLATVIAERIKAQGDWKQERNLCLLSTLGPMAAQPTAEEAKLTRGLMITSTRGTYFKTDDPEARVSISDLGCLDRLVIRHPDGKKTVSIYRYFWDDALWDSIGWFHLGYDDPVATHRQDGKVVKYGHPGYDDVEALRSPANTDLKNNVVTWGLIDAATYLGPAGRFAREGVAAAICAAANARGSYWENAAEEDRMGSDGQKRKVRVASSAALCAAAPERQQPLIVASHSLGSRVVFDVLTTDLDQDVPGLSAKINALPMDRLQVYFLANQIPLFGAGRIDPLLEAAAHSPARKPRLAKPPQFVAFSEINDLLTYELVPYFEHMAYLRDRDRYGQRASSELRTQASREQWVRALGFDVVDVRANFVGEYPILGLAAPGDAHSGYLSKSRRVPDLLMDGVERGVPRVGGKGDCKPRSRNG